MAFFSKIGSILKQASSKQIAAEFSASRPSIYQAIRCMSTSKVFVGGISYGTDDHSLREAFSKYGEVLEARVILDRETGRSRGFGFVTYTSSEEASSAIQALDGKDLHGRNIRVNYAADRNRGGGGFGGGGGYSGGGAGGGYNSPGGYAGGAGGGYGGSPAGGYGGSPAGGYGGSPSGGYGGSPAATPYGGGSGGAFGAGADSFGVAGSSNDLGGSAGFGDEQFGAPESTTGGEAEAGFELEASEPGENEDDTDDFAKRA
ncbi:Glycine-rich RNA-binding protein 3, mitochondrial [Linum grandiflorum]